MKRNSFIQLWLIIGIVAGFAAAVFFIITYLNNEVLCDFSCVVRNQVTLALILTALFGMFIGSLTYYFISEKYERKIGNIRKNIDFTYRFLEPDQKKVIKTIVNSNGSILQSKLVDKTGFSRVKVSRVLKELESKKVVGKEKKGMTNKVSLKEDLKEVFV